MLFRLAKFWLDRCDKPVAGIRARLVLGGLFALGFFGSVAQATVTVTPAAPYGFVNGSNVWYVSDSTPVEVDTTSGFTAIPLNASSGTAGILWFDVSSDGPTAAPSGTPSGTPVITVFALTTSTTTVVVPIDFVDGAATPCNSSLCNQAVNDVSVKTGQFPAALYQNSPGVSRRIGFYLAKLCDNIAFKGLNPSGTPGCLNAVQLPGAPVAIPSPAPIPPATAPVAAPLVFNIRIAISQAPDLFSPGAIPIAGESTDLTIRVQAGPPHTNACPTNLNGVYFPGDGAITVDPNFFSSFTITNGNSPNSALMVLAKKGNSTPANYADVSFSPFGVLLGGAPQSVTGFDNTLNPADVNTYGIRFGIRDAAGALSPSSDAVCGGTGIRTTVIDGYLKQSKCFIATAAYGTPDAWGVRLLRRFRDRILLKTTLGASFVDWYYSWSPNAAHWLILNPQFRWFILAALVPLQLMAWLMLNPPVLGAATLFGFGYWVVSRQRLRRRGA